MCICFAQAQALRRHVGTSPFTGFRWAWRHSWACGSALHKRKPWESMRAHNLLLGLGGPDVAHRPPWSDWSPKSGFRSPGPCPSPHSNSEEDDEEELEVFVELEVGDAARSSKACKTLVSKACEGTGRMDMLKAISTNLSVSSFTGPIDI